MDLSSAIAAVPRQRSYSQVRVPPDSWPNFTLSDSRLHQPGGPGPLVYITQEKCGTVVTSGTGFSLCRLLRMSLESSRLPEYKSPYRTVPLLFSFLCLFIVERASKPLPSNIIFLLVAETLLASRCVAKNYSGFEVSCHSINTFNCLLKLWCFEIKYYRNINLGNAIVYFFDCNSLSS
jgi:hypothetical protein